MLTVLVTSAGTASAISVIKSLRRLQEIPVKIHAVDADPLAAGLRLADTFSIVSKADDSAYPQQLIDVCKEQNATILFAIYSKEIEVIAKERRLFESSGIKLLLPPLESIALSNDKAAMDEFVRGLGIRTPRFLKPNELGNGVRFPIFVKPRKSSSSANAFKVEDQAELTYLLGKYKDLIAQEYIKATEVTIDVFCDQESNVLVASARTRIATKSGQTIKAKTISNTPYFPSIEKLCKKLQMVGVCNFQFFEDKDQPIFIELNPRFAAGGLMLTVEAGANLPGLVVKTLLGLPISQAECQTKNGILMTRYWEELFIH